MSSSSSERQPWEYADGPTVGVDVEITGAPREEDSPGVVREPDEAAPGARDERRPAGDDGRSATNGHAEVEMREVRAEDPALSPGTNARLTEELREVVGEARVRVPADRPHAARGEERSREGRQGFLSMHGFQLVRLTAIVLTFGAIIALITNDWWVLPLAAGIHALGTMTVWLTSIRMTTITEHPSPQLAAALAEEGVTSPDERFSRMVDAFREEPERGTGEVLSPGYNERTSEAHTAGADAGAEQSSAMTPTAAPSQAAGEGGAPDLLIWSTATALLVLSIILPAVTGGGWMWLLTAVMLPLIAGWSVFQRMMVVRRDEVHLEGRAPLVTIVLCTALAVAIFCSVVALAFQH